MEALVVYPARRATRWLVRLVRIAFLISLALTVGLLLVRYLQQGPAFVPQASLLLSVAGCVSLTMVALRTDLARRLFLAGSGLFCEPRQDARRSRTLLSQTYVC